MGDLASDPADLDELQRLSEGEPTRLSDVAIRRAPASHVKDESDLGDLPVTVDVGMLPGSVVDEAIANGAREARRFMNAGLIHGAALLLQGRLRVVGAEARIGSRELALCP